MLSFCFADNMGLIHDVKKRKKTLAAKNNPMPPSKNSTQDVVGAVPRELLEISDTLNLDKTQPGKEDNSDQECSISESRRNKSHDRQGKKSYGSIKAHQYLFCQEGHVK